MDDTKIKEKLCKIIDEYYVHQDKINEHYTGRKEIKDGIIAMLNENYTHNYRTLQQKHAVREAFLDLSKRLGCEVNWNEFYH